jgi:hypothetical protein
VTAATPTKLSSLKSSRLRRQLAVPGHRNGA